MKLKLLVATAIVALFSTVASAQMGPGMMGGYGPGYGMGPGMMGGYGPGYGMGPGMMGGYGPGFGMGPGMMGGYGPGYGMGPGMMGGYGPGYGMGPGMMSGCGYGYGGGIANLSSEQRARIAKIQEEFGRKQWALMQSMHETGWGPGANRDGQWDENAARKAFDEMTKLRKQMFENMLDARKQFDGLLTKEQREQFRRGW